MYDLKSSVFGGYKKKKVDALLEELNGQLKDLTASEKMLKNELAAEKARVAAAPEATVSSDNSALIKENQLLRDEVSELKALLAQRESAAEYGSATAEQISKNQVIKAYNSGYNIVQKSLDLSDGFFNDLDGIYAEVKKDAEQAIDEYETVGNEVAALLSYINSRIISVKEDTDSLIVKARYVSDALDKIGSAKNTARTYARKKLNEYEATASEFIGMTSAVNTAEERKNVNARPAEETVAQNNPIAEQREHIAANPAPVQAPINNTVAFVNRAEQSAVNERQAATEPTVVPQETVTASAPVAEAPAASVQQVNNAPAAEPHISAVPANDSFTQFGRKSRVSDEERERLIKQVLYSGNKK